MRVLVVAALFGLALFAPLASADDWTDGSRRLEIDASTDGFELRSERRVGKGHDEIRLRLEGGNVRFRFEFRQEAGGVDADAELRLELERVIEFHDENADGAFQDGEDVRAEHTPSDLTLTAVSARNVSAAGVPGIEVTANYTFDAKPASRLALRATVFGDLTSFQDRVQHPVEVKADIVFSDLSYDGADTRPGIVFRVRAASTSPTNITADGVTFEAGDLKGSFRWRDNATVDRNETRVGVTVRQETGAVGEQDLSVAFAYVRGANIVHDPTFAFLRTITEAVGRILGNPAFYALGAAAAVFVFGGLAAGRRVRKVKRT
jgi:hypothetical protein